MVSNNSKKQWIKYYQNDVKHNTYPESFVVRLLLSKRPYAALDQYKFKGSRILDLSCGNGRNIPLLSHLKFDVYATEVSKEFVTELQDRFQDVSFETGTNNKLPFMSGHFDYLLACNSCYYLDGKCKIEDNLREISRVIKNEGWFIGSFMKHTHSVFENAILLKDKSAIIKKNPFSLVEGYRLQYVINEEHLMKMLYPWFKKIHIGAVTENFLGFSRDLYYFVCQKK